MSDAGSPVPVTGDRPDRGAPLSLWALFSVPVSALVCMPLAVVGLVLALVGLVQTRGRGAEPPRCRGRGLAITGCVIALSAIGVQAAALAWWDARVRTPILEGPVAPLRAGLSGDLDTFLASFERGGDLDRAEADAFLQAIGARYGGIATIEQDHFAAPAPVPGTVASGGAGRGVDPSLAVVPYRFRFSRATVGGRAAFRTFGAPAGLLPAPVFRWAWIRLEPDEGPAIGFPAERLPAPSTTVDPSVQNDRQAPGEAP
ncbi:MAG: DUF4190 domain-containing protein [Phycisphaeraceae bacterium]|nr:DUF4190 domain-containing protein [Phycisphaeraceae bacterium]